MAYGDSTTVNTLTDTSFSAAKVTASIVASDLIVDEINDEADATSKTAASNLIAAQILRKGMATKLLKGLDTDGGMAGSPGRTIKDYNDLVPALARKFLRPQRVVYYNTTPTNSGGW